MDPHELQSGGPCKTPIQILYEYGALSGNLPVFVMEKAEGDPHQPSFIFSVTVGDVKCTGQGHNKKEAKQRAAEDALKMLEVDESGNICGRSKSSSVLAETSNPVGLLQTLALQKKWRVPEYTVSALTGPPHKREFTVTCRLETLIQEGVGSTKKAARKAAADKMVAQLQSLSGSSEITWNPNPSVRFDAIQKSTAEKISLLRRSPLSIPNTDYIQMLLELSKEQGFEVTYFDIDELTVNGQYQCVAELSTAPVTVCHGTGLSCSNAHNDAAHSALQYIKILAGSK